MQNKYIKDEIKLVTEALEKYSETNIFLRSLSKKILSANSREEQEIIVRNAKTEIMKDYLKNKAKFGVWDEGKRAIIIALNVYYPKIEVDYSVLMPSTEKMEIIKKGEVE